MSTTTTLPSTIRKSVLKHFLAKIASSQIKPSNVDTTMRATFLHQGKKSPGEVGFFKVLVVRQQYQILEDT